MLVRLFPPIIVRDADRPHGQANAHNTAFWIWIFRSVAPFAAVLAQERYEWGARWRRGLILSLQAKRDIEVMGHAVEACVAHRYYGQDLDAYEAAEAASLSLYPIFDAVPAATRRALITACRPAAARWVDRHRGFVAWARRIGARYQEN